MAIEVNNTKQNQLYRIRMLVLASFLIALTAVSSKIAIPFPFTPVPVTMQVIFVLLSGFLLGSRFGFFAQLIYLGIGMMGLPVFSKGGGIAYLLGPTGGFLFAFPLAAAVCGWLFERLGPKISSALIASVCALLLIYFMGTVQLSIVMKKGFAASLGLAVLPFIPADIAKSIVASFAAVALKNRNLL